MPRPCQLRVVAARSRTLAGGQHAASRRPMLLFDSHNTIPFPRRSHAFTLPRPCHEPAVKFIFVAWQGNGMVYMNQTRPHCVNQMGKTQSKHLAERRGRGTAGERHGMCESAFTELRDVTSLVTPYSLVRMTARQILLFVRSCDKIW
jgi:hypothetical protein